MFASPLLLLFRCLLLSSMFMRPILNLETFVPLLPAHYFQPMWGAFKQEGGLPRLPTPWYSSVQSSWSLDGIAPKV